MRYRDRLQRWLVVRLLPNMQRVTIAAFYHRSDAEGYVQAMRRLIPEGAFVVVFNAKSAEEG